MRDDAVVALGEGNGGHFVESFRRATAEVRGALERSLGIAETTRAQLGETEGPERSGFLRVCLGPGSQLGEAVFLRPRTGGRPKHQKEAESSADHPRKSLHT